MVRAIARGMTDPAVDVQALTLISGFSAFGSGRVAALRALEWSAIGPTELKTIRAVLEAQIDAMH